MLCVFRECRFVWNKIAIINKFLYHHSNKYLREDRLWFCSFNSEKKSYNERQLQRKLTC